MKVAIKIAIVASLIASPCQASFKEVIAKQPIVEGVGVQSLNRINDLWSEMNSKFKYISDAENYGAWYMLKGASVDYWATPFEFIKKGGGDCEDWAIVAYYKLREIGFSKKQLAIWSVFDKVNNEYHALLTIKLNNEIYILDSQEKEVIKNNNSILEKYTPVVGENEKGVFYTWPTN